MTRIGSILSAPVYLCNRVVPRGHDAGMSRALAERVAKAGPDAVVVLTSEELAQIHRERAELEAAHAQKCARAERDAKPQPPALEPNMLVPDAVPFVGTDSAGVLFSE